MSESKQAFSSWLAHVGFKQRYITGIENHLRILQKQVAALTRRATDAK
ncbi:MAG: hypothetical protein IPI77_23525 [Saprospiraceae bacterium]|nr:hypothetical protein [Saprospiraceae bacterium]